MPNSFVLDSRLEADTLPVADLTLSHVLLMNDRRYPWVILVPRRAGVREWIDLDNQDGEQLWRESMQVCRTLRSLFAGDKLNVGALGNVVEQLHVHHLVRHRGDPAWPGPVWGHSAAEPYNELQAKEIVTGLKAALLS
jgi:diadenosine tetraphosphate (Ap4A) HIT family hydrolase